MRAILPALNLNSERPFRVSDCPAFMPLGTFFLFGHDPMALTGRVADAVSSFTGSSMKSLTHIGWRLIVRKQTISIIAHGKFDWGGGERVGSGYNG